MMGYAWGLFQNPDGIAVHGLARVNAADGVFSHIYPLSNVVKYALTTYSVTDVSCII